LINNIRTFHFTWERDGLKPKDRVLAALNHEESDRIPIDLGGTISTIHVKAYCDLLKYFGLVEDIYIMNSVSGVVCPSEAILRRFNVDTRYVYPQITEYDHNPPSETKDKWGIKRKFTGYYYDVTPDGHPLAHVNDQSELEIYPWPKAEELWGTFRQGYTQGQNELDFDDTIKKAKTLSEGDYAVVLPYIVVGPFAFSMLLRGFQKFLADLLLHPRLAEGIMDKVTNIMLDMIEKFVKPIGEYLDVVFFGDDLGMQTGPFISPRLYKQYIKPRQKKIVDAFKRVSNARIALHTDGSIAAFLDDFIDIGVEVINPVQVHAKGMDSQSLKQKFGKNITFWGGIDTQRVLAFGTPNDVRLEVRKRIDELGPGGGYVLTSVHNIQPLTPPQNIEAMFDEAKRIRY